MREILFRGWKDGKRAGLWIFRGGHSGEKEYCEDVLDLHKSLSSIDCIEQYTGLKDKHGKMIFEGDTLHQAYHKENDFVVVFADGGFKVSYLYESRYHNVGFGCTTFCQQNLTGNSFGKYAVIGNIHEEEKK